MHDQHFEAQFPADSRKEELAQIIDYIRAGKSCQLIGIPGVGRTTALGLLVYNKKIRQQHLGKDEETTHFVHVDFSEIRNRSLFDAMKYLFLNLTESLRERGLREDNIAVGDKFREHLQFNDELVLFQGFKEAVDYLALEKKITIVFLFSRFEEYVPMVTADFFSNLRILRNRAKYQFSIVFSLTRPIETILEPSLLADYYDVVADNHVYLNVYDQPSGDHWLTYVQQIVKKSLAEESISRIREVTAGHSKLTKLAVESLLAHGEDQKDLTAFLLRQKTVTNACKDIWNSLTPAEQSELLEGASDNAEEENYLEQVGLLRDHKQQIPLFSAYIEKGKSGIVKEQQSIVYDEHTNAIRKGSVVLSDQLTSSEFKLLRCLMQNQDRIVERDELITVVWEGNKSTAGITDQAVDQLVFRVRRKIEEDPNHPQHLQTVKGRGFRFSP